MVSFKNVTKDNIENLVGIYSDQLGIDAMSYFSEIVEGLNLDDEDIEYAVSVYENCALIRIFDMGRYLFVFPCELDEDADVVAAIDAVAEYAMREEIPLVFVDTPPSALVCFSGFRHLDIDADDPECESYRVRIKTECELVAEIPQITQGRVTLNSIKEEDISSYARLCKDENVNKCWGYNYKDDVSDPADSYFYENASADFARGVALNTAIRVEGQFVGESTVYAFDGRGGAEFAIRLLPEWQGRGIGKDTVLATKSLARKMGLVRLYAKIMKENIPSIAMLRRFSDDEEDEGSCISFMIQL